MLHFNLPRILNTDKEYEYEIIFPFSVENVKFIISDETEKQIFEKGEYKGPLRSINRNIKFTQHGEYWFRIIFTDYHSSKVYQQRTIHLVVA